MAKTEKMVPAWTELDCNQCGTKFMATRTQARPKREVSGFCGECAEYARGYNEGLAEAWTMVEVEIAKVVKRLSKKAKK